MAHRRTWVLALAAVASLMTALDALVVSASLTTIQADLGATAHTADAAVNRAIPAANTRRRPYRSPSAAAGMSSTAITRL